MFLDYPKSWISDSSNYSSKLNYCLSDNDKNLVFEKYGNKIDIIKEKESEIEICIIDGNLTNEEIISEYTEDLEII